MTKLFSSVITVEFAYNNRVAESKEEYIELLKQEYLARHDIELEDHEITTNLDLSRIVQSVKERATFSTDLWNLSEFYFQAPKNYDPKASKKAWKEDTNSLMSFLINEINNIKQFDTETVTTSIKQWITSSEIGFGKIMMPLRLSLVGSLQGPDVFEIISILGKEETVRRIQQLQTVLS